MAAVAALHRSDVRATVHATWRMTRWLSANAKEHVRSNSRNTDYDLRHPPYFLGTLIDLSLSFYFFFE